jgi:hypothetical protein
MNKKQILSFIFLVLFCTISFFIGTKVHWEDLERYKASDEELMFNVKWIENTAALEELILTRDTNKLEKGMTWLHEVFLYSDNDTLPEYSRKYYLETYAPLVEAADFSVAETEALTVFTSLSVKDKEALIKGEYFDLSLYGVEFPKVRYKVAKALEKHFINTMRGFLTESDK